MIRSLLILFTLLVGLNLQGQNYTVTENNCRVYFSNALDREAFWVDQLLWRHVGSNPDQLQIFDGISAITVQDANLVNYPTTDSLIVQMEAWIVECDTAGQAPPVPPAPSALFANARSIDFDGVAEYVQVADSDELSMIEGGNDIAFSITAWVNMSSDGSTHGIVERLTSTTEREYSFWYTSANLLTCRLWGANNTIYESVETQFDQSSLLEDQWAFVAFTYDGSELAAGMNLYINGIKPTLTRPTAGVYTGMTNEAIPLDVGELNGTFNKGKIDQVCVWRGVELTLPEIKEIMTIRDVTQFTYYDSLVLYQEYDRPDSTQANGIVDLSPAGNNGTMQSGEYADLNECIEWPYPYQLDTSATVANLTPMQSAADTSFGGFGWGFDGVNEYITVGDDDLLSFGDGVTDQPFSFTFWYDHTAGDQDIWISKSQTSAAGVREYYMQISADDLGLFLIDASTNGSRGATTQTASPSGGRVFGTVTFSGNTGDAGFGIKAYYNAQGSNMNTSTSGSYTAMENTVNALNFMSHNNASSPLYYNGNVNDIILWDKELSAAEVLAIYNDHAPRDERNYGLADNIVGYWRGYNSTNVASGVLDQSGNGLNGTPTNTDLADFQYTTPREIFDADTAGSVDFDGLSDYISIADSDSLTFRNAASTFDTSFTISLFVYMDDATDFRALNKWSTTGNQTEYVFGSQGTDLFQLLLFDGANNQARGRRTAAVTAYENQWVHFVGTYDGRGGSSAQDGINIYINGVVSDNADYSVGNYASMDNTTEPLQIGYLTATAYADGKIAHTTIMKGIELTQCQVQEIYNDGSPVDPRNWTFWDDSFIHYKLNQSEDLESTEGVTNISPNGSCNGTAQSMTNAANKITTSYPTN